MTPLFFTNTLTKKKEAFTPLSGNKVTIYACGITPYDLSHIGHGRSYVFVDLLVRYLRFCRFEVNYVRNITDIDDKLIKKAEAAGGHELYKGIAEKFTTLYQSEMAQLNCLPPEHEPKVTDAIDEIITFIAALIEKKNAYVVDGDVYFEVRSYNDYGKLSGREVDDLLAGARVEVDERKKHPADFALWKGNKKQLFWKAPWGYGRPGWHIECSVLAKEFLDESIDIHCGGADLIFPHHENERAQSVALHGKPLARYWLHNALLSIDKEKMSKSLGNMLTLKELFKQYDPMIVRYYFLQHHYRTPIEFKHEHLDAAKVAYSKIIALFEGVDDVATPLLFDEEVFAQFGLLRAMMQAFSDDLNSSKAIGLVFKHSAEIKKDPALQKILKHFLQTITGLTFAHLKEERASISLEIKALLEERTRARAEKNWSLADEIRDKLVALGYKVQDKKL